MDTTADLSVLDVEHAEDNQKTDNILSQYGGMWLYYIVHKYTLYIQSAK